MKRVTTILSLHVETIK